MANLSSITLPNGNTYNFKTYTNNIEYQKSSASGSIAHFEDGSESDAVDVVAYINPVQDLHGYDSPWPAGGGKNLIDYLSCTGVGARDGTESSYGDYTSISGNVLTITQTYSGNGGILKGIQHPSIAEGTSFTVSFEAKCTGGTVTVGYGKYAGGGTNQIENKSVTANTWTTISKTFTAQGDAVALFIQPTTVNTSLDVRNLQLELGSTPTSYAPYSNICPISGFTGVDINVSGVNVWDEEWEEVNGHIESANYIPVKQNTEYYWKSSKMPANGFVFYDKDKVVISTVYTFADNKIVTPSNCYFCKFKMGSAYGTTYNHDISINYPSTDHDYHPYNGDVYPITFPSEAGTVYGGYVDVTRGKLVVDSEYVDLSILEGLGTNFYGFDDVYKQYSSPSPYNGIISCEMLPIRQTPEVVRDQGGVCFVTLSGGRARIVFRILGKSASQTRDIITGSSNHMVFKLATPIEYDITPQQIALLLGVNNIWHDANGDTDVEYIPYWMQKLVYDVLSPLSSFYTTVGDGSLTSFTIAHYLNTKNILVSVNITDNNVTYIAPLTNLTSSGQIGYSVIINSNDSITISFTSAPPIDGAEISIISAIAYTSASDQSYLRIG